MLGRADSCILTLTPRLLCPRQTRRHMVARVRAPSGGSKITSEPFYPDLGLAGPGREGSPRLRCTCLQAEAVLLHVLPLETVPFYITVFVD